MQITEGVVGHVMVGICLALGVAVVILGIRGLAVGKTQGEALGLLPGSVSMIGTWSNNSKDALDVVLDDVDALAVAAQAFADITLECQPMQAGFDAEAGDGTGSGFLHYIDEAKLDVEDMKGVADLVGDVVGLIDGVFDSVSSIEDSRKRGFTALYGILCGLMVWEIIHCVLRRLAPKMTSGCLLVTLFGTTTIVYLIVMILIFIVTALLMVVTIILGDICTDPDAAFPALLGSSNETESNDGARQRRGEAGDMFGYFIDCDTKAAPYNENPAGSALQGALDGMQDAIVSVNKAGDLWAQDGNGDYSTDETKTLYAANAPTCTQANIDADKVQIDAGVANIIAALEQLRETVFGASDDYDAINILGQGPEDNFGQGLTTGVAARVNCYALNTRYNALLNVMCNSLFTTFAQTVEFLMAAAILMVFIQWFRRLARPADEDGEGSDDNEFNKTDTAFQGL